MAVQKGHLCQEVTSEPDKKLLETSREMEAGEAKGENILDSTGLCLSNQMPGQCPVQVEKAPGLSFTCLAHSLHPS